MSARGQDIVSIIKEQIKEFGAPVSMTSVGSVIEVGDGIARIHGLSNAKYNELLEFPGGVLGIALNLEEDSVAAVILGEDSNIKEGDEVKATGRISEITVGKGMIGRVVDPLGRPLDGKGPIKAESTRPLERIAPNVVDRKSVNTPVQTGIKAIDAMIPIGRGQRELIIGDRSTGKTAIALDTIINQKGGDLVCIYVAIGQKASKVARIVALLEQYGAMEHTIVVAANSSDAVALQYLAPYAGCAIGEEFMEQGKDALVVYDDLTKHAWAYRQLSLLLRRPPGREAYPGDLFYLHSRLLERAARLNDKLGGGSLTALPIIETQAGDVSAYVPTNVISITDGQIYLEPDMFNAGIRPAVNVGISVSRVGSSAQTKAMKKVAGKLKMDMGQYRELAAFAQFGTSELDKSTRMQLERGQRVTEVLKQGQYQPVPAAKQVAILYATLNGYLDNIEVGKVRDYESGLYRFLEANFASVLTAIAKENVISADTEKTLKTALDEYKKGLVV
ncbi:MULTISPECIES: F0F1 ATP synthase subunit alpha [Dehalococcoides]|uniref:ATP synthase subunit alpha n=3 Tax=Dehalococcoides mccartyi TaxID=61435 RepID=ATPA_DEHMC|nr:MULTISPECIES: F0F1 ATP synthase subunit alpha [Dehalococcoides]A5FRQ3.1 RecName: Full=ATP synthase subunit alpha; AltName: Full=ATP synthase F1 sector subunit alpha; AltName: Full=F-ATPase subunit alpha [Dehalococcoides mccartyi BAV1]Q3ZZT9.1 RecName: Full=ATP synthase subunit alpha; AltName: Full=ATP synthase F1 sector subunit alpha; AltName: Full=F-ATPase subunit alpha [Dehalococcoides mccartyi CBDB1]AGG06197.1 ATP synthase, subunit alpha [Dehalococcoides mccartyi DCMB5]AGG07629.1 ATP synt